MLWLMWYLYLKSDLQGWDKGVVVRLYKQKNWKCTPQEAYILHIRRVHSVFLLVHMYSLSFIHSLCYCKIIVWCRVFSSIRYVVTTVFVVFSVTCRVFSNCFSCVAANCTFTGHQEYPCRQGYRDMAGTYLFHPPLTSENDCLYKLWVKNTTHYFI